MKYFGFLIFLLFSATAMGQVFRLKPKYELLSSRREEHKKKSLSFIEFIKTYSGPEFVVDLDQKTITTPQSSGPYTEAIERVTYNEATRSYVLSLYIKTDKKYGTNKHNGYLLQLDEQGAPSQIRKFWGPSHWPSKDTMYMCYFKNLVDIDLLLTSEKVQTDTIGISSNNIESIVFNDGLNVIEKRGSKIYWKEGSGKNAVTRVLTVLNAENKKKNLGYFYELQCQEEGTQNYFLFQYQYSDRRIFRGDVGSWKYILAISTVPLDSTEHSIIKTMLLF